MLLQTYQKNYEGGNITVPKNGIMVFYVLRDGLLKTWRLSVDEPMVGDATFRLRHESAPLATFTIPAGQQIGEALLIDTAFLRFDRLFLDLTAVGVQVNTPLALELDFEEAISINWDDLTNVPTEFPPAPHNHDDRYYLKATTDSKDAATLASANAHSDAGDATVTAAAAADATTKANAAQAAAAIDATTKANAAQAYAIQRANHTGTQAQATVVNLTTDLAAKEATANKGVAGGYAPLDGSAKVAAAYLPSYVDDVLEFANLAAFPVTGETGKIYVALDTEKQYRWSGSIYVWANPSATSTDGLPEGSVNKYWTNARTLASILTGYVMGVAATPISASDTVLGAFSKIGKWLDDLRGMAFQPPDNIDVAGGYIANTTIENCDLQTPTLTFPTTQTVESFTVHEEDALGATVNDANYGYQGVWVLSGPQDVVLTGMNNIGFQNGMQRVIRNGSNTYRLFIRHQSGLSSVNKRFYTGARGDEIILAPQEEITVRYDTDVNAWRTTRSPMDYNRIGSYDGLIARSRPFVFSIPEVSLFAGASALITLDSNHRFIWLETIFEARGGDISAALLNSGFYITSIDGGVETFFSANEWREELTYAHAFTRLQMQEGSLEGIVTLDIDEPVSMDINVHLVGILVDISEVDA